jgi:hypothetical protein
VERADGSPSGGFEDGSDIGVEFCAPFGSQALGDLSEDDTRPDRLLGAVVGGWDGSVGDEHEKVPPELLDHARQLLADFAMWRDLQEGVELGVEPIGIAAQRSVGELFAAARNGTSLLQEGVQARGESNFPRIDVPLRTR